MLQVINRPFRSGILIRVLYRLFKHIFLTRNDWSLILEQEKVNYLSIRIVEVIPIKPIGWECIQGCEREVVEVIHVLVGLRQKMPQRQRLVGMQ